MKDKNYKAEESPKRIFLYGTVGGNAQDSISSDEVIEQLNQAKEEGHSLVLLCINSPGGNVMEGLSIYHALRNAEIPVRVKVEGIAASIASVIALGGEQLEMNAYSLLMVHNPLSLEGGNSQQLRENADRLDLLNDSLAEIYASHSVWSKEEALEHMARETWLTAKEAQEFGFCDILVGEQLPAEELTPVDAIYALYSRGVEGENQPVEQLKIENEKLRAVLLEQEERKAIMLQRQFETHLDEAIASGKVGAKEKSVWLGLFDQNREMAKAALESIQRTEPLSTFLSKSKKAGTKRTIRDWEKEDPTGLLEMRRKQPELYTALFEEYYGG